MLDIYVPLYKQLQMLYILCERRKFSPIYAFESVLDQIPIKICKIA